MTLEQFMALGEIEQMEAMWPHPVIAEKCENEYHILLFQLDGFYVELYHNVSRDSLEKIRAFSSTDHLQAYLEKINIEHLFRE